MVGSKFVNSAKAPLASGKIYFVPNDGKLHPLNYRMGGGGQSSRTPVSCNIVSGAITGSCPIANVAQTDPPHVCFNTYVVDSSNGSTVLGSATVAGSGYTCVQPSTESTSASFCSAPAGTLTCDLDKYHPDLTAIAPVTAPTLSAGTFTTGAAGSSVACTVNVAGSAPNYALNCAIPQGLQGVQGIPALLGQGKGAYNPSTSYNAGEVVAYNGQSYASLTSSNVGNQPDVSPTRWGLLANLSNLSVAFSTQSQANPQPVYASTVAATTVVANNLPSNANYVACFGDSICQGNEDGTGVTQLTQIAALSGRPTTNYGIGGQTSGPISVRVNAYAGQPQQTFAAGFTLPTSGSVACTFYSSYAPAFNLTFGYGGYPNGVPISFVVGGTTYTVNVLDSGDHTNYNCTPTVYPGSPVAVPSGTHYLAVTGTALNGCVTWDAGTNGAVYCTQAQTDNLAMASAVSKSTSCWYAQTVLNAEGEPSGSAGYTNKQCINTALLTNPAFTGHVIDVRSNLVASYNPSNAADVLDHTNDIPPYSLRSMFASGGTGSISGAIDAATCAIPTGTNPYVNDVLTIDSELILLTGGSTGAWTCTRGWAGTTAATHSSGATWKSVNSLHPGNPGTANITGANSLVNGLAAMGTQVYNAISAPAGTGPLPTLNSALGLFAQNGGSPTFNAVTGSSFTLSTAYGSLSGGIGNHAWQFLNVPYIYGCSMFNTCLTILGDETYSGLGSLSLVNDTHMRRLYLRPYGTAQSDYFTYNTTDYHPVIYAPTFYPCTALTSTCYTTIGTALVPFGPTYLGNKGSADSTQPLTVSSSYSGGNFNIASFTATGLPVGNYHVNNQLIAVGTHSLIAAVYNLATPYLLFTAGTDPFQINGSTLQLGTGNQAAIAIDANQYVGIGNSGLATTDSTYFDYRGNRHLNGPTPTASAGTLTGTNEGGYITSLSATTSVTITFSSGTNYGWTSWVSCSAASSVSLTTQAYVSAISTTSVTFTFPSLTGSLYYSCHGK